MERKKINGYRFSTVFSCLYRTKQRKITDQPDDAQRDDEPQAELEIATDDNSVDDTDPDS